MDIADDLDGRRKLYEGWLAQEYFACSLANAHDFCVLQAEGLANLASVADIKKSLNHIIDIEWRCSGFILGRAVSGESNGITGREACS